MQKCRKPRIVIKGTHFDFFYRKKPEFLHALEIKIDSNILTANY